MKLPPPRNSSQQPSVCGKKTSSHDSSAFEPVNVNAAGIDIGSAEHWVCVPSDRAQEHVRRFGCFTPELRTMAQWMIECGIQTAAMEATGVYWIPVFQMLESMGIEVVFVLVVGLLAVRLKALKPEKSLIGQKTAFRLAAQAVSHSRSALGAFYRRVRSRLGAPKAITATAHKLARLFYRMWTTHGEYTDPGMDYYEQKYHERVVNKLKKKAQSLGFELVAQPDAAQSVS